jgi:hypothetical protein
MDPLTIVRAIAILFIAVGVVFALQPDALKGMLRFAVKGRMMYLFAAIRIFVGILFIWVGGRLHANVLGAIGVIILLVGITTLVVKLNAQKALIGRMINGGEILHRCIGITAAIAGTLILVETFVRW